MQLAKPLPKYMEQRYHGWRATTYDENKFWYQRLEEEGQRPRAMIISCCDSRVNATAIFGADAGELFIHRNIANLVPPYNPDGDHHGTSAAVEYAVQHLKVAHLLVIGHSSCGGVRGCMDMCEGHAPELEKQTSFIGRWLDILRPGWERVSGINEAADRARALEQESVVISLENLMSFPYIAAAVEEGRLTLHGLWAEIGNGRLHSYDPGKGTFTPV